MADDGDGGDGLPLPGDPERRWSQQRRDCSSDAPGTPPYWLVYFGSDDVDADLAKISELGGKALVGPMDIGMGKIAVAQDPQGAVFALFSGDFDD